MITIALLLSMVACSKDESKDEEGHFYGLLELNLFAEDTFDFKDFDDPAAEEEQTITFSGATFYRGYLYTFDNIKTEVYVTTNPSASIDRILITINGGTGLDPRYFIDQTQDHKLMVVVSQRGLHPDDLKNECFLGEDLVECLKAYPNLAKFNPEDNGRDVVDVMRVITGDLGEMNVNGSDTTGADFFQDAYNTNGNVFNIKTGSYGATILGYALADENISRVSLGRIFIDGPSSPGEHVITDGFRNGKVVTNNIMDSLGMNDSEKMSFLNILKARHTAPNQDCSGETASPVNKDCLSSAMIWHYMLARHDKLSSESEASQFKTDLLNIPVTEATGSDLSGFIDPIYRSDFLNSFERQQTSWETHDLRVFGIGTPVFNTFKSFGFSERFAQICSAYINRTDGDSQSAFDAAKSDSSNDPYWYGFLIIYRLLLDICPQIASNTKNMINIPSASLDVEAELLVQYGAGLDEKHHEVDIDEIESYFSSSTPKVEAFRTDHTQGGLGFRFSSCRDELESATYHSDNANDALTAANAILRDTNNETGCGL